MDPNKKNKCEKYFSPNNEHDEKLVESTDEAGEGESVYFRARAYRKPINVNWEVRQGVKEHQKPECASSPTAYGAQGENSQLQEP
jgi:hypothetical protein